LRHMD